MIGKKKRKMLKVYIAAVIILLVFLYIAGVFTFAEKSIFYFLSNSQSKSYGFLTKLKYSFINYQEATNLKKENLELKTQLNQSLAELVDMKEFEMENKKLREFLNFQEEQDLNFVMASVIGQDMNRHNTLIINRGKNDGLAEGFGVVVDNGVIVGKIINVRNTTSTMLFLTDNFSKIPVSLQSSNKTIGLAEGEFGLTIKINLIPQDLEISEGDMIITSGLEENIPRGLMIGKINRIISNENELFKSATINTLADYEEITILSVIIPNQYENN